MLNGSKAMSHTDQAHRKAKFSDMDLRVGQRVQLIQDTATAHKHYTSVIGYVENEFLILRVPKEDGWIVHLNEGMNVEVRLFSGLSIFTFKSRINTVLLNPRNYMLLSFPELIEETPMRSHLRVRTSLPVEIVQAPLTERTVNEFHLFDLSGGGASIIGPVKLGAVEEQIKIGLRFDLQSTGKSEHVELEATIQNIEPVHASNKAGTEAEFQHGIQFKETDARLVLLVHELQQRKK